MNRCIACYRCVRYYKDYAGGTDLDVFGVAHNVYFGRTADGVLENEFSGNLVEVCPTGVFTDKTHGERYNRKWDMQFAPSICQGCSVGCNISPGERYGELRRIENRYNGSVEPLFPLRPRPFRLRLREPQGPPAATAGAPRWEPGRGAAGRGARTRRRSCSAPRAVSSASARRAPRSNPTSRCARWSEPAHFHDGHASGEGALVRRVLDDSAVTARCPRRRCAASKAPMRCWCSVRM